MINNNQYIALFITLSIGVLSWYNVILFTSKDFLPIPNINQYIGLFLALILSILYWLRQIYIIII